MGESGITQGHVVDHYYAGTPSPRVLESSPKQPYKSHIATYPESQVGYIIPGRKYSPWFADKAQVSGHRAVPLHSQGHTVVSTAPLDFI